MIKIKDLDAILASSGTKEVRQAAMDIFAKALNDSSAMVTYVHDFCNMPLPQAVCENYYNEGLSVLLPVVNSKKKLDISTVSKNYIFYTGLLNHEFVIGCDLEKEMSTSIFTKSENLLNMLAKAGAFDDMGKFEKNMKALFGDSKQDFGNKVVSSFENNSLAMGRLDISAVIGDSVSLDLVVPNKFRSDFEKGAKDGVGFNKQFILYPYSVFPHLNNTLAKYVLSKKESTFNEVILSKFKKITDIRAIAVIQNAYKDGQMTSKTRRVTFAPVEVVKAYERGSYRSKDEMVEAQNMLKIQLEKTSCAWDCLKLYFKAYNVEASLFNPIYTGIKLERTTKISMCSLKDIDTSHYLIDYDSVKTLFRASVNNWNLEHYQKFNSEVDTEQCANKRLRMGSVLDWAEGLDNDVLWNTMKKYNDLFSVNDNKVTKTLDERLFDMYNRRPSASKNTQPVTLSDDMLIRKEEVKTLLKQGVCKIECFAVKNGVTKSYMATNNEKILNIAYGENVRLSYESKKNSIYALRKAVINGDYKNSDAFLNKIYISELESVVDLQRLQGNEDRNDWIAVLDDAFAELQRKDDEKAARSSQDDAEEKVSYIVNFRRINADRASGYWAALDVRNITSLEFGVQKK